MTQRTARAPAPGAAGRAASSSRSGGRGTWRTLSLIVLVLPAAAVLLPTTLVLAVTLLPTLAAALVDRQPGRALALSVGLLNVAGSLPGVIAVWTQGHDVAAAQWVLGDAATWLFAYGAAACGWLLFALLPPAIQAYYSRATARRIRGLQRRQEQLQTEWGPEVAGDVAANAADDAEAPAEAA